MSYISNIHKSSSRAKNRFALLVSGGVTLFIFGVWSLVTFGAPQVAENPNEVSPTSSLTASVRGSLSALRENFVELRNTFEFYGR